MTAYASGYPKADQPLATTGRRLSPLPHCLNECPLCRDYPPESGQAGFYHTWALEPPAPLVNERQLTTVARPKADWRLSYQRSDDMPASPTPATGSKG